MSEPQSQPMTANERLIKLRAHFYFIEQGTRGLLRTATKRLNDEDDVGGLRDQIHAEGMAYHRVLKMIHTSMDELGMEYPA